MLLYTKIKEVQYLQYIGKINREMFKKISNQIITEEVILTSKQREHIEERHPGILEKYEKYFYNILDKPDYILKDNIRKNTALILKRIENKKESVNLVLRLAVEGENVNNKNSIITCIPIGKNRLKSYINNGKIIYKNE